MIRWPLPLLALIALSVTLSLGEVSADELDPDDMTDTGAPEPEAVFTPWADKVLIDTRGRALLMVWLDEGRTERVSFSKISQLLYLPAYQGSASELVMMTTSGDRHLLAMGRTVRQDAQVIAAILGRPLETIARSDEHMVPAELTGQLGPVLALGSTSGPFATMPLGEAIDEVSEFTSFTDTTVFEAPEGFIGPRDGQGELDRNGIALGIRTKMNTYRACYQRQLQRVPNLEGSVTVEFIIDGEGVVDRARVASTSLNNEQVEQCLISNLTGSQFPVPRGGGTVVVKYPFNFTRG